MWRQPAPRFLWAYVRFCGIEILEMQPARTIQCTDQRSKFHKKMISVILTFRTCVVIDLSSDQFHRMQHDTVSPSIYPTLISSEAPISHASHNSV